MRLNRFFSSASALGVRSFVLIVVAGSALWVSPARAGLFEDELEHRAFDVLDHHRVERVGLFTVEIAEIGVQRATDGIGDVIAGTVYAASSWGNSSGSA